MDRTVDALKNLYAALGGDADDVTGFAVIPDMIDAIAILVSGGALKELPTVSALDNGDILTVSSGKWAKGSIPTELPAVTSENNGAVLKVIDGVWGIGTDLTE